MLKKTILLTLSFILTGSMCFSAPPGKEHKKDLSIVKQIQMELKNRKYKEALTKADEYLADHSEGAEAGTVTFLRANCLLKIRKYDDAIRGFSDVISNFPESKEAPTAHFLKGHSYLGLARKSNSAQHYNNALEEFDLTINNKKANRTLRAGAQYSAGQTMFKQGKVAEGLNALEKTYKNFPGTGYAFNALTDLTSQFLGSGNYEKASELGKIITSKYASIALYQSNRAKISEIALVGSDASELSADNWINSDPIKLSELKGKTILLHFWSSWCPYCRKVVPHLKDIQGAFSKDELVIITVTNLHRQNIDKIKAFAEKEEFTFPIAVDNEAKSYVPYAIGGVPAAVLIDKTGKVRWRGNSARISKEMISSFINNSAPAPKKPVLSIKELEKVALAQSQKATTTDTARMP